MCFIVVSLAVFVCSLGARSQRWGSRIECIRVSDIPLVPHDIRNLLEAFSLEQ
jgi:hypothetical protein